MTTLHESQPKTGRVIRLIEIALAAIAVWWVAATSLSAAEYIAHRQPLWLLPGLYLVELAVITGIAGLAIVVADASRLRGAGPAWLAVGVLAAFIVLGAMSIGFAFIPGAALLAVAALLSDLRLRASLARRLLLALGGALTQGALMLALVVMQ